MEIKDARDLKTKRKTHTQQKHVISFLKTCNFIYPKPKTLLLNDCVVVVAPNLRVRVHQRERLARHGLVRGLNYV